MHRCGRGVQESQKEKTDAPKCDQPVSRQLEAEYSRYYGYPCYWAGQGLWGAGMYPRMADMAAASSTSQELETGRPPEGDPYLRSAREVTGYAIQARDGDLGHVEDFLVDDESASSEARGYATRTERGDAPHGRGRI